MDGVAGVIDLDAVSPSGRSVLALLTVLTLWGVAVAADRPQGNGPFRRAIVWTRPYARRLGVRAPFGRFGVALAGLPVVVLLLGEPILAPADVVGFVAGTVAYLAGLLLVLMGVSSRPAYNAVHRGGIDTPGGTARGYTAVAGIAGSPGATSPATGGLTCAFTYRISRRTVADEQRSYERTHERVAAGVSEEPFAVQGPDWDVLLDPTEAALRLVGGADATLVVGAGETPPDHARSLLAANDVDPDHEVRILERRIDPGEPVTIVGRLTPDGDVLRMTDGTDEPAYLFAAPPEDVVARLQRRVVGYLPGGVALVAAGTTSMWSAVGFF